MKLSELSGFSRKKANTMLKFEVQTENSAFQEPSGWFNYYYSGMAFSLRKCARNVGFKHYSFLNMIRIQNLRKVLFLKSGK